MKKKFFKFVRQLGIVQYDIILNHLIFLKETTKIKNKKAEENIKNLEKVLFSKIKIIGKFYYLIYIMYFILYFSILSLLFSDSPIFSFLNEFLVKFIGVVGSGTILIIILFLNRVKDLAYQDINLVCMKIISLYVKYSVNEIDALNNFKEIKKIIKK